MTAPYIILIYFFIIILHFLRYGNTRFHYLFKFWVYAWIGINIKLIHSLVLEVVPIYLT